ncbi:MAG: nicotinamide-nucleotide amidase [Chloroflexota bacterium]|jgi:nicotinamide-nucleotide amidase|nr:nicotinamide-nucleotide amidase [Chloroflexota bacterium]
MTAVELLSVGAELLLGETVDTNAAFLGQELATLGLPLQSVRMLPDDRAALRDAFADALGRASVVLATGGLGPTHDDLTREGLADALGEDLAEDAALIAALEERFRAFGPMPAANRRQAMLVPSAGTLPNPIGSAPGWWVDRDGVIVALMPGVPSEMRLMWTEQVRPRLADRFGLPPLAIRSVKAFGIGESAMAERLGALLTAPPAGVDAGIYARDDGVHARFSTRGDPSSLDRCVTAALDALGDLAYGTDGDDLATSALARLGELGISTIASWESDTEGALLSILSAAKARDGAARYLGGVLDMGTPSGPPMAETVLQVSLLSQDANGRSRVRVALSGGVSSPETELRIHGSGPQRLRRAAFAALNLVRELNPSDR